jgi:PAS domain S-box-containing protein
MLFLVALTSFSAVAAPKRVLVVHSFVNAAPPYTTHSTAFEKALTELMGERVDLDEVSLNMARYASVDMQEALVDYMRKRQAKWQPDLVVPIGAPAGNFVAKYRNQLFPENMPILYAGMDSRTLGPDVLKQNATYIGDSVNIPGLVEDILQIAPATTNIVVVIGASALESYWKEVFEQEYKVFTNRVDFTWLNNLSFDQMLDRVSHTPPRSFILFILLMRDASGVTCDADDALKRIHAVANAPVNGVFQHQLGLGIVGGRHYQTEATAVEAARVAVRILRGEPATNFPPKLLAPLGPRYDARELQRWNISRNNLPADSVVLFRTPTVWERHFWWIISGLSVFIAEALLIVALLANLRKRRRVERSLLESEQRLSLATAAAEIGAWMWDIGPDEIWATENWRRMFGFPPEAVIRYEAFLQRIHPDDRAKVERAVRHTLDDGIDYVSEHRVVRPDGAESWVAARGRLAAAGNGEAKRLLGASVDITARKRAEQTAYQLSGRLLHAQEEERARLAKELHDGLSQNLALLSVEMEMLGQRLPETPEQINERLNDFSKEAKGLSAEVHRISHGLHPAKLAQLGLTVALGSFCREVETAHGIKVCFDARDVPRVLPSEVALCLYRVAQEAIQNVVKHSEAKKTTVELVMAGDRIHLSVTDDGTGFEMGAERGNGSLGLVSMQERVRLVHGEVSVKSAPGQGTRVEARVPLPTGNNI